MLGKIISQISDNSIFYGSFPGSKYKEKLVAKAINRDKALSIIYGEGDGTRTRDTGIHSPPLYQLSYTLLRGK